MGLSRDLSHQESTNEFSPLFWEKQPRNGLLTWLPYAPKPAERTYVFHGKSQRASTVWSDMVTLDLNLPDTSREWLLTKIREQDTSRKPPVVIITAKLTIAPEVRKLAQAIVPKPFELDELLQLIHYFIPPPERERAQGELP